MNREPNSWPPPNPEHRRWALSFVAAALLAIVLAVAPVAHSGTPKVLDPVKQAEIVHLTQLLDQLPQKTYPITLDNHGLYTTEWEAEVLPWFAYEGISDPVVLPKEINYYFGPYGPKDYIDAYVFHVLGLSFCEVIGYAPNPFDGEPSPVAGPILLNGRFINPVSPWYQRGDWLPVVVHEMAHSQGICVGDSPYVESSTQLAMLEVMAAMIDGGNDQALLGFLTEWRDITEGALYYEALRDGLAKEYSEFIDLAEHSVRDAARHDASRRFWAKHENGLKEILQKYEWSVYLKAKYGATHPYLEGCIPEGDHSTNCGPLMRANSFVPSGGNLVMDDFTYLLTHLDERVAAA